ncbi:MAG: 50S ribosomal protein L11 methyltransferase [Bauldia sp.]|nr:50S ribosomal protein L11 methyltransferase [Bauldia sp.]
MYRAGLAVADEATATRVAAALEDALGEAIPVSWSETADGWLVEVTWPGKEEPVAAAVRKAAKAAGLRGKAVAIGRLPDIDWVAKSLEGLPPVRVGRFVVHGEHDRGKARANDIAVEIPAAQAFGTGHHGTTAACLAAIAALPHTRRFRRVLDLGTGSGVLAIAIARAWRVPVLATDIDPVAIRIAAENARRNGVARLVTTAAAPGFSHRLLRDARFDLVVANILAGPLAALAPGLARRLDHGGVAILSGMLPAQRTQVVAAYRNQRLALRRALIRDGWLTLVLEKR